MMRERQLSFYYGDDADGVPLNYDGPVRWGPMFHCIPSDVSLLDEELLSLDEWVDRHAA